MLETLVITNQRNWDMFLLYALSAYRSSIHDTTRFSPNKLLFERENGAPLDLVYGLPAKLKERQTNTEFVTELSREAKCLLSFGTSESQTGC